MEETGSIGLSNDGTEFKVVRTLTTDEVKLCLNPECYDYLIPVNSSNIEKTKRNLDGQGISYKEQRISFNGEESLYLFVRVASSARSQIL